MNIKDQESAPVISIEEMKDQVEQKRNEDSISRYLGILSFSQLIDETTQAIKQLDTEHISKQSATKSQLVLKELGNRIEKQLGHQSVYEQMKAQIELTLKKIQRYL